jgi:hypothetical protein
MKWTILKKKIPIQLVDRGFSTYLNIHWEEGGLFDRMNGGINNQSLSDKTPRSAMNGNTHG